MIAYGRTLCRSQLDKYFSPLLQSLYPLYELKIHINRVYKTVRLCNYTLLVNNPVPVSLLSGDRKPQIRFLGNHHSGSGNLYHKSFRM